MKPLLTPITLALTGCTSLPAHQITGRVTPPIEVQLSHNVYLQTYSNGLVCIIHEDFNRRGVSCDWESFNGGKGL